MPGRLEVLREEGIDGVRYTLWNVTGWHRDCSPLAWRSRATDEQKRVGWEMAVRIEKVIAAVLQEAYRRQVEEILDVFLRDQRACINALRTYPERRTSNEYCAGTASARSRHRQYPAYLTLVLTLPQNGLGTSLSSCSGPPRGC